MILLLKSEALEFLFYGQHELWCNHLKTPIPLISGDITKSAKVQQNVKYDSETGKVYEELGSSSTSNCNNQQQPSTSESSSLLVNSATASASMINGSSPFQNGSSFQAGSFPIM